MTHVMVHPGHASDPRAGACSDTLAARPDFELMGVAPGGLHLYRLH